MEGQSSVRKQAKFSRRILCSKRRILRSPMLNEHPERVSQMWPICGTGVGKLDDYTELNCMGPL